EFFNGEVGLAHILFNNADGPGDKFFIERRNLYVRCLDVQVAGKCFLKRVSLCDEVVDTRLEDFKVKGLCHIVTGAGREAVYLLLLCRTRGEHDHRNMRGALMRPDSP